MTRRIEYELKEISATDVTSTFQSFGSAIENPCIIASFVNNSDVEMYISKDGIQNTFRLPSGGTLVLDTKSILEHTDVSVYLFRVKTQLEIKLQNPLAIARWGAVFVNILTVTSR